MSVVILVGSPSATSKSARIAEHAAARLTELGHRVEWIRVRELPADALMHADAEDPDIKRALDTVLQSGAVLMATPIYKAAYSGLLKIFLDLFPKDALAGKIVLPIATGRSPAHVAGLDDAMRPVLLALTPDYILRGVYAEDPQVLLSEFAGLQLPDELAARLANGLDRIDAFVARAPVAGGEPAQLRASPQKP